MVSYYFTCHFVLPYYYNTCYLHYLSCQLLHLAVSLNLSRRPLVAHARHITPVIRSERATKSGQAKLCSLLLWEVWEDGIMAGFCFVLVGWQGGRPRRPRLWGKREKNGKRLEKQKKRFIQKKIELPKEVGGSLEHVTDRADAPQKD